MKKLGFTLLEVLACMAIITVIAAILSPVLRSAKHSAQITSSISNLHQMHVALLLYQSANGGGNSYSSLASMGLPTEEQLMPNTHTPPLNLPYSIWRSPCGQNPSWDPSPNTTIQYEYLPSASLDNFEKVAPIYQENLTMFVDLNCAEHGEPLYSEYLPHRGLGVQLSGALLNRFKPGDCRFQRWWADGLDGGQ